MSKFLNIILNIKMSFLALTLAPIRVVAVFIVLFAANIVSIVGLIGISEADLRSKPLEGGDLFSKLLAVNVEVSTGFKCPLSKS